jgi:hypothetical protein
MSHRCSLTPFALPLIVSLLADLGTPLLSQSWTQLSPSVSPPGRIYHAMSYDSQRNRAVVFGGYNGSAELGDTWEWDPVGNNWLQRSPANSPTNRQVMAFAYDASRGRTVMWGGAIAIVGTSSFQFLSDTWEWDGNNWAQLASSGPMLGRCGAALVHDSTRQRCILFGGEGTSSFSNDVWEWDGTTWLQVHPGGFSSSLPAPRFFHSMVYDSGRGRVVVFGGKTGSTSFFDTWEYNPQTQTWTQIVSTGPSARSQSGMIYDPGIDRTFLYGGENQNGVALNDVWVLNGASWTPAPSTTIAPPPRRRHVIAHRASTGLSLMFGGLGASGGVINETWALETSPSIGPEPIVATQLATTSTPPGIRDFAMAPLPTGGMLLFGGQTAMGRQPFTYTSTGASFSPQYPNINPAFRSEASLTLDAARGNNVLFGGRNPLGVALGDTWTWQGSQWVLQNPSASPPARSQHEAVWDPQADVVLVFGGKSAQGNALGDCWEWNGASWMQRTNSLLPPARWGHVLAYDAGRARIVLHGGQDANQRFGDIWEYDGANWSEVSAIRRPNERHGPLLVRDAARGKLVLFGGRNGSGFFSDTWELEDVAVPSGQGALWTRKAAANPPSARSGQGFAYDVARNRTLAFGGFDGTNFFGDMWLFDGIVWAQALAATLPPPRTASGMCYDTARAVAVLFGGLNATTSLGNDTWEWNGSAWSLRTTATAPPSRFYHSMSYDSMRQRTVLFGGRSNQGALLADTWEYDGVTWTLRATSGPSPRQAAMMCFDPVRNETVLFGGGTPGAVNAETWTWNGSVWSQRSPAVSPAARLQGAMVFDPARARIILFGGGGPNWANDFSDTWEWDGANWTPATLVRGDGVSNPGPRADHAASYDPRSERILLFGGQNGGGCLGDAWSWDGDSWSRHQFTSVSPFPRSGAQMWRDGVLGELVLFGGGCGSTFANDLWSLQIPVYSRHETYGQGCLGSIGMPTLVVDPATAPVIGTTLELIYQNVPGSFIPAIGSYGTSRSSPLPVDLGVVGLPGCQLWQSAEVTGAIGAPNLSGRVRWPVQLPNSMILLGSEIFFQCLHLEVPGFPRWASTSNGVAVRIGQF